MSENLPSDFEPAALTTQSLWKGDNPDDEESSSANTVFVTRKDKDKSRRDKRGDSKLPGRAKLGRKSNKRDDDSDDSGEED